MLNTELKDEVRVLLEELNKQTLDENAPLFPRWSLNSAEKRAWSLRPFFKRVFGLVMSCNRMRSLMEVVSKQLHKENRIDDATR
jgi:hypothetical protein